jgi:hypothetical protein
MSLRSGLAAQIGYGEEVTPGHVPRPDAVPRVQRRGARARQQLIRSAGLRAANRMLRTDRVARGRKTVAGQVNHEVHNKGFGLLLKHMHGKAAVITTPATGVLTRDQTFDGLGDPVGLSMTVQKGVPDVGGTVRSFSYLGCKVASWSLSNSVDGILMLGVTWDGIDEDTGQSLAAASYASSTELLNYTGGVLNVGGARRT